VLGVRVQGYRVIALGPGGNQSIYFFEITHTTII